ncbi:hypothetical protein [Polynucleobacter sp. TUM22923]|nr:hypothetical protein [Polynucleobacter sp. TUM22923]
MKKKNAPSQWLILCIATLVLMIIFSAYFAPNVMIAIANHVWAWCS